MIRLWNRLVKMSDDRLTKNIFIWDTFHCHPWASELKSVFYLNKTSFIFHNKLVCDIQEIRRNMVLMYREKWSIDLRHKPKPRTYCVIKNSYSDESYVKYNLTRRQRSLCAQLRSGTLPIALETGRFNATPEEDRVCLLCDLGGIENEIYFLFHCPIYDGIRSVLFSKMSSIIADFFWLDDYEKLELCLRSGTYFVAAFICKAWEKQQNIMYKMEQKKDNATL